MTIKTADVGALPVSFLCRPVETVAALDGISSSDVIRRAVLADVRRRKQEALKAARCRI